MKDEVRDHITEDLKATEVTRWKERVWRNGEKERNERQWRKLKYTEACVEVK